VWVAPHSSDIAFPEDRMRAKLQLDLDQLTVDSFDTTATDRPRGTVFGEQCTCYTNCTCPGCPTCDATCAATCAYTCDDASCAASCNGTCNCPADTQDYTCNCPPSCLNTACGMYECCA
jgi:hypothetical protein